jgi:hypothetical protein
MSRETSYFCLLLVEDRNRVMLTSVFECLFSLWLKKNFISFPTQNYWVFGHFPSSGILENTTFRKLDLFPFSGEGGGEDTYSVGPLRKN